MKIRLFVYFLLCNVGLLWAQDNSIAKMPGDDAIQSYLSVVNEFAALYNGKLVTPYDKVFSNDSKFESEGMIPGTLCYNHVVYTDVLMSLDLFRNEFIVYHPNKHCFIALENEKFDYAILNGSTIVLAVSENETKDKYLVLLHQGPYPVVRKYKVTIHEGNSTFDRKIVKDFIIQKQYAVYVNDVPCAVKNKSSILKLFADRKKELNEFAKQHKLNFKGQIEQSIVALVNHYESINK